MIVKPVHEYRSLGDDGVAAGADVGHVGFDRDDALAVEFDARARRQRCRWTGPWVSCRDPGGSRQMTIASRRRRS